MTLKCSSPPLSKRAALVPRAPASISLVTGFSGASGTAPAVTAAARVSSRPRAWRASPSLAMARASTASSARFNSPASPRSSTSARASSSATAPGPRAASTNRRVREIRALFTSKLGFSVVAPMRVTSPRSTQGSRASCWALLKRWISSRKRMVRWPVACSRRADSAMTAFNSLEPTATALYSMNRARVWLAARRARVVLPQPGGPHSRIDGRESSSSSSRKGPRVPSRSSCPTTSARVRGRMRSAKGAARCG